MGPLTWLYVFCTWLGVVCNLVGCAYVRRARLRLAKVRGDAIRAHAIRLATLDERRDDLLRRQRALEPYDSLERYASKLRDANEVHRERERVLRKIAMAAVDLRKGSLVARDPGHGTVHVRIADYDALVEALKGWGPSVMLVDADLTLERSNNLSGPADEGELPEAG